MVHSDSNWRQGPEILIHCTSCGEQNTPAETSEQYDTVATVDKTNHLCEMQILPEDLHQRGWYRPNRRSISGGIGTQAIETNSAV